MGCDWERGIHSRKEGATRNLYQSPSFGAGGEQSARAEKPTRTRERKRDPTTYRFPLILTLPACSAAIMSCIPARRCERGVRLEERGRGRAFCRSSCFLHLRFKALKATVHKSQITVFLQLFKLNS